jgi:ATP-dependent Clp protease ATP-binding subunit ClpA
MVNFSQLYLGILILTSNRVGIFDEAFKSRIQLSLRYQNLDRTQRLEIWRNFISRLERLAADIDGLEIDAKDILDHIDKLATPELNGREIRNAISTARQLARYRKQALGYTHIQAVIAEAEKFDQYLQNLHEGVSADERQNDKGER